MISVTIQLHSAKTGKTTLLGRMVLWNKGDHQNPKKRGNYGFAVKRKGCEQYRPGEGLGDRAIRVGEVLDYPRLSYNVWRLVLRALKQAFPEEK